MQKSLPKKVETDIVVTFLNEALDQKFGEFRQEVRKDFTQQFGELKQQIDTFGSLITTTHQEVKHFIELHKLLDGKVADLEHRVAHLEQLVKA